MTPKFLLAVAAVAGGLLLAGAAVWLIVRDGDDDERAAPPPAGTPTPPPASGNATPAPDTEVREPSGELAVGITEPNPNFVWPRTVRDVPQPFARWRVELDRMAPTYYRLVIDWPSVWPAERTEPDLQHPEVGCLRTVPPCNGWLGIRDQLKALAAQQRAAPGRWQALVVLTGTPEGLEADPRGCERAGTQRRSRPPTAAGVERYRRLIAAVLQVGREEGADLRFWSPWNEPNHPYFLSPQRARCRSTAPSRSVAPYVQLARAMREVLDQAPGDQELVLGELAGLTRRTARSTAVDEFVTALPRDLVCASRVYSQHGYIGGRDPVDDAALALARHRCPRTHEVWITETGVGGPRRGEMRDPGETAERRMCGQMRARLRRWYEDPRVTAAFQYTLREDDRFPTGLVTTALDRAYPVLAEWQAWSARARPSGPPPRSRCGG
jgi:hypothetical protein